MLRRRLTTIALTVAAVAGTTLMTAQPAQAERSTVGCEVQALALEYIFNMFEWHYTFYGPAHAETAHWALTYTTAAEAYDTYC